MADAEENSLRLPKPIQISTCDMRPELVNFSGERRWDLLGFVRQDEIEDVKACNVDETGNRYYLVHWKDSWKAESSLIYCEKLLQQFWAQKSLLQHEEQATLDISDNANEKSSGDTNLLQNASTDLGTGMKNEESANVFTPQVIAPTTGSYDAFDANTATNSVQSLAVSNTYHEDVDGVDLTVIHDHFSLEKEKQESQLQHIVQNEESMQQPEQQQQQQKTHQSQNEFKTEEEISGKDGSKIILLEDGNMTGDSYSIKGASKRKNRLPRQSVQSSTSSSLKTKKDKVKKSKNKSKKSSKVKISKMVEAIITTDDANPTPTVSNATDQHVQNNVGSVETIEGGSELIDNNKTDNTASGNAGNEGNLKCMVCDKSLTSQQNLMKHLLTHNNNHTCTVCMKTFKSTHFLKHHMDKHNPTYQYACPVCGKKFKFKNNMRGHLRKHSMEKKFECEVCHKKFIGRYNLKEHMKAHSDERPYECDFCRKSYKDRGALNKHLLTHQDKKVECEQCGRQFTNSAQLKRHMQFHLSWPGDSFKRKSMVSADGEKLKHTCEYCNKTFNHYSNMNAHIHKKHKEKKIECKECSKMFAYQYELREHMFIHSGGQEASKFKCKFCEKSFQRSTTLKNHERTTHLGIKRFKCEICGKMFGTKFNMKVHVEKLHSTNDDDGISGEGAGTNVNRRQSRTAARNNEKLRVNELGLTNPAVANGAMNFVNPANAHHQNAVASMTQVSLPNQQHPLLRNMSANEIIRNAMSNMPELGYFPGLQTHSTARAYQFYGIPPPDFGVPN